MILSILIPTLNKRRQLFQLLNQHLTNQIEALNASDKVQIIPFPNNGGIIGIMRNELVKKATGKYIVFIDDDDWVSDTYIEDILQAAESDPDVITFNGWMTTDGASRVDFVLKLGEDYCERGGLYYRYPNHLCPIKREIARMVHFKNIHHQEDYKFATELRDRKLLKTEVHIEKQLYHYRFLTNK